MDTPKDRAGQGLRTIKDSILDLLANILKD
jgi:hypothetical protein